MTSAPLVLNSANNTHTGLSSPGHSFPIPVLLLKTRSTPTDAYFIHFSSPTRYSTYQQPRTYDPLFIPVLEHSFREDAKKEVREILLRGLRPQAGGEKYGGIILTSQRAVEALERVLEDIARERDCVRAENEKVIGELQGQIGQQGTGTDLKLGALQLPLTVSQLDVRLYTVGPATSRALESLRDRFLPRCRIEGQDSGEGKKLAEYILARYPFPQSHSCDGSTSSPPPSDLQQTQPAPPSESSTPTDPSASTTPAPDPKPSSHPLPRPPLLFLIGAQHRDIIPITLTTSPHPIPVSEIIVYETTTKPTFQTNFEKAVQDVHGGQREQENADGIESGQGSGLSHERSRAANREGRSSGEWHGEENGQSQPQGDDGRAEGEGESQSQSQSDGQRKRPMWVVVFSPAGCTEMVKALQARKRHEGRGENADGSVRRTGTVGEGLQTLVTGIRDLMMRTGVASGSSSSAGADEAKREEREIFVATIGPTTRDYLLRTHGFVVDVCARKPTPEALAEGMEQFMRDKGILD
ncbi:hypothetical protein MMC19_006189 [Ptychographa xylographoides]|nr:hypothetical protein [Ptychographa xylographoides]